MPLLSTWSRNASLDACYGSQHAANWPASVRVRLFTFDPREGGVELPTAGGYAAVTLTNNDANVPPASGGEKTVVADFGTSTAAWGDVATWAVLSNPDNNQRLDGVALSEDVNVTAAGFGVPVTIVLRYDEETD